jgi:hypothetical protein
MSETKCHTHTGQQAKLQFCIFLFFSVETDQIARVNIVKDGGEDMEGSGRGVI